MSCSCTGNCDLINIEPLVLSDTFHTWYDRTNEIIDTLNPLNVYDVNVGMTDGGLTAQTTCINGNTNGVITLKVNVGPGIGVGTTVTPNYYLNRTMIDVSNMTILGATGYSDAIIASRSLSAFPSNNDWYIVSDAEDGTLGSGAGTPKRVKAEHMLPPTVYLPPGFQFNGNISVNGNLSIQGTASNIDSNDLRIEDKIIEIAFHRLVSLDVTGPTSVGYPAQGMTFHYYDPGVGSTADYTTVGQISEVNFNGAITNLKLHNFSEGGVNDIVSGGRLSITGSIFDFTMAAGPTTTEAFYTNSQLDEAGFLVRGSEGDKQFLWVYDQGPIPVTYNAFVTNTNLGISGDSNAIISSRFKAFGYNNSNDNKFHFVGHEGTSPAIRLGGLGTGSDQYGYWSITRQNYGLTTTQQPLVFGFKQYAATGEATSFTVWSGASGPTYATITVAGQSNNRVGNFAQGLNVDYLDGAHGTTMPTAWSIPVALSTGKIHRDWVDASGNLGKCYNVVGHSFKMGDAVRLNGNNGSLTGAIATSVENAEVLGIVSSVTDADNFCIVTKGFIDGLTGVVGSNIYGILPLVTGHAYFLSPDNQGALVANPDFGANALELGEVRKPMFIALSSSSCYVHNYLGVVEGIETDIVDVQGVSPVGMIMPFSGEIADIPTGWLLCNGSRLEKSLWSELYAAVKQNYYAEAHLQTAHNGSANVPMTFVGGTKGLQVNDAVTITGLKSGVAFSVETYVTAVTSTEATLSDPDLEQFDSYTTHKFSIYGRIDGEAQQHTSIFFVPELRSRTLVGVSAVTSLSPISSVGTVGGVNSQTLNASQIPQHDHYLNNNNQIVTSGDSLGGGGFTEQTNALAAAISGNKTRTSLGPIGNNSTSTSPFDNMQAYVAVHWIIRAKRGMSAMILSGHNHDDRYIRYDAAQTPALVAEDRTTFKNNAKVLGNGFDGAETFHNKLTITGGVVVGIDGSSLLDVKSGASFGGGATFNGAFVVKRPNGRVEVNPSSYNDVRLHVAGNSYSPSAVVADILIDNGISGSLSWEAVSSNGSLNGSGALLPINAGLKIRGGTYDRASIALFNDNADGGTGDTVGLRLFGRGATNSSMLPYYIGGFGGGLDLSLAPGTTHRSLFAEIGVPYSEANPTGKKVVLQVSVADGIDSKPDMYLPQGLVDATAAEMLTARSVVLVPTTNSAGVYSLLRKYAAPLSTLGGPKFIAPQTVYSSGDNPTADANLVELDLSDALLGLVPVTATALIWDATMYQSGPDNGSVVSVVYLSPSSTGYQYVMIGCRSSGGSDGSGTAVQATIPYDPAVGSIWRRLSHQIISGQYVLRVVGYY